MQCFFSKNDLTHSHIFSKKLEFILWNLLYRTSFKCKYLVNFSCRYM